jgi:PhzF family phenazine biosynthesis protein
LRTVRFRQVDVFTDAPFRGNPVAVVLDGDGLATGEMQRIAGWTNLSETTFVLRPQAPGADYRLRIFTPRAELPFAGHPTIGSAHAVLEAGIARPSGGRLVQECGAGLLELSVGDGMIALKAPAQRITPLDPARVPALEKALGAKLHDQPRIVEVGPVWIVAELGGADAVDSLRPDLAAIAALAEAAGATGVTVFGESRGADAAIHVRSFAPAHGVPEDPVCGSGNISVAAYLRAGGQAQRFGGSYHARQGMALGRDGRVAIRLDANDIHLAGRAVTCVEGTLRVE